MDSTSVTALGSPIAGGASRFHFELPGGKTVPGVLLVLAILSVAFVDRPLAALISRDGVPDGLKKLLEAAEHFGTFYGHVLAFLLIALLDREHRRRLVRIGAAAWSAGLAANVVKLLVARTRPKYFDFDSLTAGAGFLGLAPGLAGGSRIQSFPSAHTATAVAFAIALSHAYPRGRAGFFILAGLVGLQRLATSSHFASDVLAGAIVGWIVGQLFTSSNAMTERFNTFEAATP